MNNKKYFWVISILALALIGIGGYWGYQYYFKACCEPPVESVLNKRENNSERFLVGNWTYFSQDAEGYSSGIDVNINQVDNTVAGEFNMVWSFPKAPAARLNNGTFHGKLVDNKSTQARVDWIGSRDDSGTAEIYFNAEKDAIEWRTIKSVVSDLTMPDTVLLYRNRWPELSVDEQSLLAKTAANALEQIPGMDGGEIFAEDTTVIGNRASVPFASADGENTGTLYLEKQGSEWKIIPDPESGSITM